MFKEEKEEITHNHYDQLIDRLEVINANLHEHCFCHPLSEQDNEINMAILDAVDFIFDTVQFIAFKRYEFEEANINKKA